MNRDKYMFKKELKSKILDGDRIKVASQRVGISQGYLTNILNGKIHCSILVANRIILYTGNDAKLEDYFEVIK